MSEKININRTLYIGVGGTGAKTLARIKAHFINSYGEVPSPMIGFLAIDTQDGIREQSVVKAGSDFAGTVVYSDGTKLGGEEVMLDRNEVLVITVNDALNVYRRNPNDVSWMPRNSQNANVLSTINGTGAGQVRSNGRFIAQFNRGVIRQRIVSAISQVQGEVPVTSKFRSEASSSVPLRTTINVIASVAGGTGSGMLFEVIALVNDVINRDLTEVVPWVVLPDVFEDMSRGDNTASRVKANAFAALRDLDYLFCNDYVKNEITYGASKISERPFKYAFLFNKTNGRNIDVADDKDIYDALAKSAFLPSNDMGTKGSEVKNNIVSNIESCMYDIPYGEKDNKRAWACSSSASELVYDNKIVATAATFKIVESLSNRLLGAGETRDVYEFIESAKIHEDGGDDHNQVLDAICPLVSSSFELDKTHSEQDVIRHFALAMGEYADKQMLRNYASKLNDTKEMLSKWVFEKYFKASGYGVRSCLSFLRSLEGVFDICIGEMSAEKVALDSKIAVMESYSWRERINHCRTWWGGWSSDEAGDVANDIDAHYKNILDRKRHEFAYKFFLELKDIVAGYLYKLGNAKSLLEDISQECSSLRVSLQHACSQPRSKFQIFIHAEDLGQASSVNVDGDTWNAFCTKCFSSVDGLASWLEDGKNNIKKSMIEFAEDTAIVTNAKNISVEQVLGNMTEEKREEIFSKLVQKAEPLWQRNYKGHQGMRNPVLSSQLIVGVPNISDSIVIKDKAIQAALTSSNGSNPSYASIRRNDRIYVMKIESAAPVYAVNKMGDYAEKYEDAERGTLSASIGLAPSNFSVEPPIVQSPELDYWTKGFVFNLPDGSPIIRYDMDTKQYWMHSERLGDPLKGNRVDLGMLRHDAYKVFRERGLYKEVQMAMEDVVNKEGSNYVNKVLESLSGGSNEKYFQNYVKPNCNELEVNEAFGNNPVYAEVRMLLEEEVKYRMGWRSK